VNGAGQDEKTPAWESGGFFYDRPFLLQRLWQPCTGNLSSYFTLAKGGYIMTIRPMAIGMLQDAKTGLVGKRLKYPGRQVHVAYIFV